MRCWEGVVVWGRCHTTHHMTNLEKTSLDTQTYEIGMRPEIDRRSLRLSLDARSCDVVTSSLGSVCRYATASNLAGEQRGTKYIVGDTE